MRIALVALLVLAGGPCPAESKPQRIVSLNVCTDQILVDLVPRQRIAALSYLATDASLSAVAAEARGLTTIRGSAEEVLALDADLVIVGQYSTPATVALLKRLGRRVVVVPLATDLDGVRKTIRMMADAVGEEERGQALVRDFDRRLAAAKPQSPERPTALAYQVNSLASTPGSLVDSMLTAAGFENATRTWRLGPAGRVPLEEIVAHPPDFIVLANAPDAFRSVVGDNLRHPAFRQVLAQRPHIELPMPLWLCGSPRAADGVERLAEARRAMYPRENLGR